MSKKTEILEAALQLFNDHGTKSITTNHIAKAVGISPGNLYYHFKNKEAIIYELYLQMQGEIGFEDTPLPKTLCELKTYCEYVARIWWHYRFFRKELMTLVDKDQKLYERVVNDNRRQKNKLSALISHLQTLGYLHGANEQLSFLIMLISQFWMPYQHLLGEMIDEKKAMQVSNVVIETLSPYLTQKAQIELNHCKGA